MKLASWITEWVKTFFKMDFRCPDCPAGARGHGDLGDFIGTCLRRALTDAKVLDQPTWEATKPECPVVSFEDPDGLYHEVLGYWTTSTNDRRVHLYFTPFEWRRWSPTTVAKGIVRAALSAEPAGCGHPMHEYLAASALLDKIQECREHVRLALRDRIVGVAKETPPLSEEKKT